MPVFRNLIAALSAALLCTSVCATAAAAGPYNEGAGMNAPAAAYRTMDVDDGHGHKEQKKVEIPVTRDQWGNATGNQHDLAVDGAFDGQTVAVLQLYTEPAFDFAAPRAALKEKGFSVYRWSNDPPPAAEFEKQLAKANQLWVISDCYGTHLKPEHVAVIQRYFDQGHGVYIWGDNEPCYGDANILGQALLGVQMHGNVPGDKPVTVQRDGHGPGVVRNHLLSTGVETVYEGITIATIDENAKLTPIIYGSAGNLVTAAYDKGGKRAILDGGFTRLYYAWNTAGTARYIKNAAAWLANYERFGQKVATATPAPK
jgi:hypothetical protein